jgi:hypothetical protein
MSCTNHSFDWLASRGRQVETSSVFSTEVIRSIISVPVYKRTCFARILDGQNRRLSAVGPNLGPPSELGGESLNGQSFQPGSIANHPCRPFQTDQPFFLQLAEQSGDHFV